MEIAFGLIKGQRKIERKDYEIPCKPGNLDQMPCWIAPYHHRITWQMWFAAMPYYQKKPWLIHFVYKILKGNKTIDPLLSKNPFPHGPPKHIRLEYYLYKLASPFDPANKWYTRTRVGSYLPPLAVEDNIFSTYIRRYGWTP